MASARASDEGQREREREKAQDGSYSPIITNLRSDIASLLPCAIGHKIMEGTRQGCEYWEAGIIMGQLRGWLQHGEIL